MQSDVNILVVDDEEIMRSLFQDVLGDKGHKVTGVAGGKAALEKVRDRFFDIIFIDVHMPVMDGMTALKKLREASPKSSFIMMDSFPSTLLAKANKEGAVACINKPFNIREVIDIVQRILEERKAK